MIFDGDEGQRSFTSELVSFERSLLARKARHFSDGLLNEKLHDGVKDRLLER